MSLSGEPTPLAIAVANAPRWRYLEMQRALKRHGISTETRTFGCWLVDGGTDASRHVPAPWLRRVIAEALALDPGELWPEPERRAR